MNAILVMIGAFLVVPLILGGAYIVKHGNTDPGATTRNAAAGGSWGTKKVVDRRAMWARRYGAGAAWTAGTIGITGTSGTHGVGDPHATGGGVKPIGGGAGCSTGCGGGVGCGGGGCGGGGCGGS
jgi:hypothetical protein